MSAKKDEKSDEFKNSSDTNTNELLDLLEYASEEDEKTFFSTLSDDVKEELTQSKNQDFNAPPPIPEQSESHHDFTEEESFINSFNMDADVPVPEEDEDDDDEGSEEYEHPPFFDEEAESSSEEDSDKQSEAADMQNQDTVVDSVENDPLSLEPEVENEGASAQEDLANEFADADVADESTVIQDPEGESAAEPDHEDLDVFGSLSESDSEDDVITNVPKDEEAPSVEAAFSLDDSENKKEDPSNKESLELDEPEKKEDPEPAPKKEQVKEEPQPSKKASKESDDYKTTVLNEESEDKTMAVGQDHVNSSDAQPAQTYSAEGQRNPLIDMKNADYIRFAQDKIKNLEAQLSELRSECEELALAGDHFKNLSEERGQKVKTLEAKIEEIESLAKEEKKILNESISSKDLRIQTLQEHVEGLEEELESRFNRVRVRERDLESRLEILKQEQSAVTKSKDEMILKLRNQNNGLQSEIEKLKAQHQKTSGYLQTKEDALRRTMKALKLSLTMLESQNKE